jgi:hypothetical protein
MRIAKCGFLNLPLVAVFALTIAPLRAQLPNETDTTSTPAPGDHDYLHSPVETVNPANGSVSIRIPIQTPPSRGLSLPFAIAYDSNGSFSVVGSGGTNEPIYQGAREGDWNQGGWSYTVPLMSFSSTTWTITGTLDHLITCHGSFNYVFEDPGGGRHNLGLSVSANVASGDGTDNCNSGANDDGEYPTGGEGSILATTTIPATNIASFPPTTVTDGEGTQYYFRGGSASTYIPQTITDRNGNTAAVSESGGTYATNQLTFADSIGRAALTSSGFGGNPDTITAAGESSAYKVYWTTASAQFTDNTVNLIPGEGPNCQTAMSSSATVVSQIVLPDGQSFNFSYDPTYGMLTKLTYPGGGYVRYVWG